MTRVLSSVGLLRRLWTPLEALAFAHIRVAGPVWLGLLYSPDTICRAQGTSKSPDEARRKFGSGGVSDGDEWRGGGGAQRRSRGIIGGGRPGGSVPRVRELEGVRTYAKTVLQQTSPPVKPLVQALEQFCKMRGSLSDPLLPTWLDILENAVSSFGPRELTSVLVVCR